MLCLRRFASALASLGLAFVFTSAKMHIQTSADPLTGRIVLDLKGEQLEVNLEGPGVLTEKYRNGELKSLILNFMGKQYNIFFHPKDGPSEEQIALVQRFRVSDGKMLLHGATLMFDKFGTLLRETDWYEGKLHGAQNSYNADAQILEERKFQHGYPIGTWKQYYYNGTVASEMAFPASDLEWEKTRGEGGISGAKTLYAMAYAKPVTTKEIWYSLEGRKIKDIEYQLYQEGTSFIIKATGIAHSFGSHGEITRRYNTPNGTGTITSDNSVSWWFNDTLFKRMKDEG